MTAQSLLYSAFSRSWPPELWSGVHVLVAVSGGADSVALLRAAAWLKLQAGGAGRLHVAHYNHLIRGASSDADALWVEGLAAQLDLPFVLGQPPSQQPPIASEEQARNARYEFLLITAEQLGARFVITGHTSDDQVETLLLRIFRGASIQGLAGIPKTRSLSPSVDVVRPLLQTSRGLVERYLGELSQEYRTDPTNSEPNYTRNRLRNDLLPRLREEYGRGVDASLLRLSGQAREAHEVVRALASEVIQQAMRLSPEVWRIDTQRLSAQSPIVVREACKLAWRELGWPEQAMGHDHWLRLYDLLVGPGQPPAISLPGGVVARRLGLGVELRRGEKSK